MAGPLGRLIPPSFEHVQKYPFSAVAPRTVTSVEKVLRLPSWHWSHDQGREGSCVGHASAMERAITNTAQNIFLHALGIKARRYDPIDIWNAAKAIDEYPDTNPGDGNGTSVHAAYDVLRQRGPTRVKNVVLVDDKPTPVGPDPAPTPEEGVASNLWATSVDEIRTAISTGIPVVIGVSWYTNFDRPIGSGKEIFIGNGDLGTVRGGHSVCLYGASDKRQAFRLKNSWGRSFPLVWIPYSVMGVLLGQDGEACLTTDK